VSKYKNPAVIPPLQSRVALAENLQNRQNLCQLEITCLFSYRGSAVQARISTMPNTALKLKYR
jgi:hypothetical protein